MKKIVSRFVFLLLLMVTSSAWAKNFVVVKADTKFFPSQESSEPLFQSAKKGFITLEVLEEKDKRVQVKIAPKQGPVCYMETNLYAPIELHLWVDKKALEKVITEKISKSFKDGSEFDLAPGLVVQKGEVFAGTSTIKVKVPKAKTARSFQPKFLSKAHGSLIMPSKAPIVSAKGLKFASNQFFKKSAFQKFEKVGRLHQIRTPCFRVKGRPTGKAKDSVLLARLIGGGGAGYGRVGGVNVQTSNIPKATPLFSKKGELIGLTQREITLPKNALVDEKSVCQSVFFLGLEQYICVQPEKVKNLWALKKPPVIGTSKKRIRAQMRFGKIEVRGGDEMKNKKALRKRANAFKYCYVRELNRNPKLAGNLSAQAKIGKDGRVKSTAIVQSTLKNSVTEECVLRVLKRIRFAAIESTINLPLEFSPVEK